MAKLIDRIALICILFVIFLLWLTYLTGKFVLSLTISFTLCALISILIRPKKNKKTINVESYLPKFATMTKSEINDLLFSVLPDKSEIKVNKNNFIQLKTGEVIIPKIRMTEISADEICKISEQSKRMNYSKIILLVAKYDKTNFEKIKPYLSVPVEILKIENVLESLQNENNLPKLKEESKAKRKFNQAFSSAIKRKNAKYFLVSGISMAFLSIFTPLKLYYLLFATITLILSLLCFIKKHENDAFFLKLK